MKALKALCFAISLIVAMTLSLSATANTVAQATKHAVTSKMKASKQVMFVTSAAKGSIHHLHGDDYVLYLDLNNIKQILLYTQRPDRIYRYVKKQGLKQAWYGKDNLNDFSRNPPNAVLATQDAIPSVVTITHMGIVQGGVVFVFHAMRPGMFHIPTGKVSEVALTIDAVVAAATGVDPMSGLQSLGDQGPLQMLTFPTGPTQLVQHTAMSKLTEAIKDAIQKGKAAKAAKAKAKAKSEDKDENGDEDSADEADKAGDEADELTDKAGDTEDEVADEANNAGDTADKAADEANNAGDTADKAADEADEVADEAGDTSADAGEVGSNTAADSTVSGTQAAELGSDLGDAGALSAELGEATVDATVAGGTTQAIAGATGTAVVGSEATLEAASEGVLLVAGAEAGVAGA